MNYIFLAVSFRIRQKLTLVAKKQHRVNQALLIYLRRVLNDALF